MENTTPMKSIYTTMVFLNTTYEKRMFDFVLSERINIENDLSKRDSGVPVYQPPAQVAPGKPFCLGGGGLQVDLRTKPKPNQAAQIICYNPKKHEYRPITDILSQQTPKQTPIQG